MQPDDRLLDEDSEFEIPRCRVCSCTDAEACEGGCCWIEDPAGGDLCSACLYRVFEAVELLVTGRLDAHALEVLARFAGEPLATVDPRLVVIAGVPWTDYHAAMDAERAELPASVQATITEIVGAAPPPALVGDLGRWTWMPAGRVLRLERQCDPHETAEIMCQTCRTLWIMAAGQDFQPGFQDALMRCPRCPPSQTEAPK